MFKSIIQPHFKKYIFSIAHTDYTECVGGVQKLIKEQSKLFQSHSVSYVFACPLTVANKSMGIYQLFVDDLYAGVYTIKNILMLLSIWENNNIHISDIHIHHLMFWRINDVKKIINKTDATIKIYLHDFYLICKQHNLINSSNSYCGEGIPSINKCKDCNYFVKARQFSLNIQEILDLIKNRLSIISPSNNTKNIWVSTYANYSDNVFVIEHLKFIGNYHKNIKSEKNLIKVAYIGSQTNLKGWSFFKDLVKNFSTNSKYQFYHFGQSSQFVVNIINIPVSFQTDGSDAMTNAIRNNKIDCAIFWPQCPETYNYTCYEAFLGGAWLITNKISGNIADMVRKYSNGKIFYNDIEVIEYLKNFDKINKDINSYNISMKTLPDKSLLNDEILSIMDINKIYNIKLKHKQHGHQSIIGRTIIFLKSQRNKFNKENN